MDRRFPIGPFQAPAVCDASDRASWLQALRELPPALHATVAPLSGAALDRCYRAGGWSIRQVLHHLPDSHLNAYLRFKLALTEDQPTIKPYREDRWALLPDTTTTPVAASLALLDSLHQRRVLLMELLSEADWARCYVHPETGKRRLDHTLALYAWHGRHHLAHIHQALTP